MHNMLRNGTWRETTKGMIQKVMTELRENAWGDATSLLIVKAITTHGQKKQQWNCLGKPVELQQGLTERNKSPQKNVTTAEVQPEWGRKDGYFFHFTLLRSCWWPLIGPTQPETSYEVITGN